ncbi:uncharacterized protein LOC135684175 isoform X2 [Rhopilema esculentum]|uniref:uncharacterized protein LOC135684175 isoform X2 n=1 Tax=Rhopilema esculentum TaxID=499914 RepID=UPI0031D35856
MHDANSVFAWSSHLSSQMRFMVFVLLLLLMSRGRCFPQSNVLFLQRLYRRLFRYLSLVRSIDWHKMRSIIHATSIIGCSISLLFCLLAVLVLGCYREKTRLLLIKQQQSITLVFINIVMLTGFQGLTSQELCQAATTLLHYFVLACFSWLTADQYFIFKSVVKMKPYVNFMKLFVAAWGFPVPFVIVQLLIGFLLDQDIGSVLYSCWGSDFVALTLLIPAGGLSVASMTMLSITVKSVIKRPAPTTYTRRKTDQAIKYGIKTSSVMIFITSIVWVFAHLLFWYPDHLDFQLIFALSSGLQGLFNFFFNCVFALELDIYVSDKLFSETDDVDEFTRNTGSVKLSSINRQDIQNMESLRRPQKRKRNGPFFKEDHDLPPMIEEEPLSFHKGKTTPTISRRLSDPLPWFPAATSSTNQVLFGGKLSAGKSRKERIDSQCNGGGDEEEGSGGILDDDASNPLPFLRPTQAAQRIERAKENAKLANSLLLPAESFSANKSEKQQDEPRRSCSLPSCSMPTPKRYVTATDAPGYGHGTGMCSEWRHERTVQPVGDASKSSDIEESYSHGLFASGQNGSSMKIMAPGFKLNGQSRVSVPTMRSSMERDQHKHSLPTNEIDRTSTIEDELLKDDEVRSLQSFPNGNSLPKTEYPKDREKVPAMAVMQVQPYSSGVEGQQQEEIRRSNSEPQCITPELESLFSNQDLISAADRRVSAQSENQSVNAQPGD